MYWQMHYQKLHYEGEWTALPLRSVAGKENDIVVSPVTGAEHCDTPLLEECPYIKGILNMFPCPLQVVRLLKLSAGAVIKEHIDPALNFEKGEVRIHIPVKTSEQVEFYLQDERIMMKEGECWYVNFNLPHRINNNSNIDRVHLVIDAVVNDWIKELFSSPAITQKKEVNELDLLDKKTKRQMIERFRDMNTPTGNRLADELEASLPDQ